MPELPDVAVLKRYLDATALHNEIADVDVRDDYVLKGVSARKLADALKGRRFESTLRHGKNLLVETDGENWLRLHFGMTGNLNYHKKGGSDPEHTRVLFAFADGYHLAYVCPRKLGRISLTSGPEEFAREQNLGPDAGRVGQDEFTRMMDGRRGMLKTTLMNQSVIAGLGNVYTDEVLFQARLHPETKVKSLSREQLRGLHRIIQRVIRVALNHDADARDFPRTYLAPHRGAGEDCPRCGADIRRIEVNQRGTYICPRCQQR